MVRDEAWEVSQQESGQAGSGIWVGFALMSLGSHWQILSSVRIKFQFLRRSWWLQVENEVRIKWTNDLSDIAYSWGLVLSPWFPSCSLVQARNTGFTFPHPSHPFGSPVVFNWSLKSMSFSLPSTCAVLVQASSLLTSIISKTCQLVSQTLVSPCPHCSQGGLSKRESWPLHSSL